MIITSIILNKTQSQNYANHLTKTNQFYETTKPNLPPSPTPVYGRLCTESIATVIRPNPETICNDSHLEYVQLNWSSSITKFSFSRITMPKASAGYHQTKPSLLGEQNAIQALASQQSGK